MYALETALLADVITLACIYWRFSPLICLKFTISQLSDALTACCTPVSIPQSPYKPGAQLPKRMQTAAYASLTLHQWTHNKTFPLWNLETVLFKHNLKQRPLTSHCYSGGYGSLGPCLFSCRERLQPAITHSVAKEVFSQAGGRLHCWHRARTHLAGPQISVCVSVCVCVCQVNRRLHWYRKSATSDGCVWQLFLLVADRFRIFVSLQQYTDEVWAGCSQFVPSWTLPVKGLESWRFLNVSRGMLYAHQGGVCLIKQKYCEILLQFKIDVFNLKILLHVIYCCDAQLNFQHHYSSFQCLMILQKSF